MGCVCGVSVFRKQGILKLPTLSHPVQVATGGKEAVVYVGHINEGIRS